jgi:hypothetical protein
LFLKQIYTLGEGSRGFQCRSVSVVHQQKNFPYGRFLQLPSLLEIKRQREIIREKERETERKTERERQREKDREAETERQRDRETERKRDRETERQRETADNKNPGQSQVAQIVFNKIIFLVFRFWGVAYRTSFNFLSYTFTGDRTTSRGRSTPSMG